MRQPGKQMFVVLDSKHVFNRYPGMVGELAMTKFSRAGW